MQRLNPADYGGIVGEGADRPLTEVWRGPHGIECAIVNIGFGNPCGYVRVPDRFRERAADELGIDFRLQLTWGPDAGGWIGFDADHAWDTWVDPDVPESRQDRHWREIGLSRTIDELVGAGMVVWTLEKLREAVDELAEAVHAWAVAGAPGRRTIDDIFDE